LETRYHGSAAAPPANHSMPTRNKKKALLTTVVTIWALQRGLVNAGNVNKI
jgi:hypothetical protein